MLNMSERKKNMEDPSIIRVVDAHEYTNKKEVPFSFYVLWMCAHAYAMRQKKVLNDNEWAGWLSGLRNSFRKGTLNDSFECDYRTDAKSSITHCYPQQNAFMDAILAPT